MWIGSPMPTFEIVGLVLEHDHAVVVGDTLEAAGGDVDVDEFGEGHRVDRREADLVAVDLRQHRPHGRHRLHVGEGRDARADLGRDRQRTSGLLTMKSAVTERSRMRPNVSRSDDVNSAAALISATPIISAEAVRAVRRGDRMALSRANLPGVPNTFWIGLPIAPATGRADGRREAGDADEDQQRAAAGGDDQTERPARGHEQPDHEQRGADER